MSPIISYYYPILANGTAYDYSFDPYSSIAPSLSVDTAGSHNGHTRSATGKPIIPSVEKHTFNIMIQNLPARQPRLSRKRKGEELITKEDTCVTIVGPMTRPVIISSVAPLTQLI